MFRSCLKAQTTLQVAGLGTRLRLALLSSHVSREPVPAWALYVLACPFPPIGRAASLAVADCTRDNLAQFTKPQPRACDGRAEEPVRRGQADGRECLLQKGDIDDSDVQEQRHSEPRANGSGTGPRTHSARRI